MPLRGQPENQTLPQIPSQEINRRIWLMQKNSCKCTRSGMKICRLANGKVRIKGKCRK